MRFPFLVILAAFLLAACGQSEPPAKWEPDTGPAGPAGPRGFAGPPGPPGPGGPAIRVIKAPCDQTACGASCKENEEILNAYALNPGGAIDFRDERNVTFRPKQRPTVLVLACIAVAQEPSVQEQQPSIQAQQPSIQAQQPSIQAQQPSAQAQQSSVEDRACITAAAGKLPNIAALKIEGSRALPQPAAQGRRNPDLSNVKVEIDVSVAGQSSTYVFNCVRDGLLVVIQPMGMR
jgi:hypothetical protein